MARASASTQSRYPDFVAAGEAALIVRLGAAISPAVHGRVVRLLRALEASPPPGVRDLVPAYASLLVVWDPLRATTEAVATAVRTALDQHSSARIPRGRLVRVPVAYGGADGPDLDEVARLVGLTPDEVVMRHSTAAYRVYFIGFLAGFPYLGGLPPELAVPRLPTPRPRVPVGSVGIAGRQTGIYPLASPGGWRLIGRTPLPLFDPLRDPPTLLQPGDRVRFEPLASSICSERQAEALSACGARSASRGQTPEMGRQTVPWVRVERAGWLTTVQDLGRPGYGRSGISASGAADADALRVGNALLGNPAGAAALEVTLGDVRLQVLRPCAVVVTGADCAARVGARRLRPWAAVALQAGDVLELGMAQNGMRAYICVAGGIAVPMALGSRSTDTRAGLGGLEGRPLRPGDVLARGGEDVPASRLVGRRAPMDAGRPPAEIGARILRALPGPHADVAGEALARLVGAGYMVDPNSDRVGVRLRRMEAGHMPQTMGGETLTEGVPRGAVQVPPSGDPVILLADHQTTGGYRIPAVVIGADLWRVAQLRPGDTVRLAVVTADEALAALHERARWLGALSERLSREDERPRAQGRGIEVRALMRGFAEWSEGAGDDE